MTDPRPGSSDDAGDYKVPPDALVTAVLARIGDLQHRKVFYSQLHNPKWVAPLAARHAFASAPGVASRADGGITVLPWAEGEYLARMADREPADVVAVLKPLARTDNVVVQRAVVEAASRMPASVAAILVDDIVRYIAQPYRAWLDPRTLAALLRALAEGGLSKEALRLAQALYRPRPKGTSANGTKDVIAGLEPYAYAVTLPTVVPAMAKLPQALTTAVIWLEQWQLLTGQFRPAAGVDWSYLWRRSISTHSQDQRHSDEMGHVLVDAVREIAFEQAIAGRPVGEMVQIIERGGQPLHFRIAMDFIAHTISTDLLQAGGSNAQVDASVQEQAVDHLMKPAFLAVQFRHEYVVLARAALPALPADAVAAWTQWIGQVHYESDEELRRRLLRYKENTADVSDSELAGYRNIWLRDLLTGIGKQALPDPLRKRLNALIAAHGESRDHVEFPVYISGGFVRPNSPLSVAELEKLDVDDVLAYLQAWQPGDDQVFGPSIEGLARNLTQLTKSEPAKFAERAEDLTAVDPGYIQSIFQGFEGAVAEGRSFPWDGVLRLVHHVATAPPRGSEHRASSVEDDGQWRFAQLLAANLVLTGVTADQGETRIPDDLLDLAWASLKPLANSGDPTAEAENRYGGDNMDPLTLSMNTVRPAALRTAIRLLVRVSESAESPGPELTFVRSHLAASIETAISEHAGPSLDPSLAVAAVFGEGVGALLTTAAQWTVEQLPNLLGPSGQQGHVIESAQPWYDTVWSVMLAGYRPSRALLQALRAWFLDRIAEVGSDRAETAGFRGDRSPRQMLADHILMLLITGQLDGPGDNQLVLNLFANATPELLGETLGHLGQQMMLAEGDIPAAVLERCRALWDWRASEVRAGHADLRELVGFSWWVRSGRFPAEWWLPHLRLAVSDHGFQARTTLLEPLADIAQAHPRQALETVIALIENDNNDQELAFYIDQHVPAVIAAALDCGDAQLATEARGLMNQLGRSGYTELDRQVADSRRARMNPSD